MRSAVILLVWTVLAPLVSPASDVAVSVDAPGGDGDFVLMLFASPSGFGELRAPFLSRRFPCDGRDEYSLTDVPAGEYALVVYQDENGNGRLDKNFIGIPIEPLGFSNDYRPKGPPMFARATFQLGPAETRSFRVRLGLPLGRRGQVGVGVGVIAQSSPYRGSDAGVVQAIPTLTYLGERVQVLGPAVQVGVVGTGELALALLARYRVRAYEEDESDVLGGLGDREDTLMAGVAVQLDLPKGFDVASSYEHDALGRVHGGAAQVRLGRSFQRAGAVSSPHVAINWMSAELTRHDFGVPARNAREGRAAYRPGDSVGLEVGATTFVEISRSWRLLLSIGVESLGREVTDSPLVAEDFLVKAFGAISYAL